LNYTNFSLGEAVWRKSIRYQAGSVDGKLCIEMCYGLYEWRHFRIVPTVRPEAEPELND